MSASKRTPGYRSLLLSMGVSLAVLGGWVTYSELIEVGYVVRKLLIPLARLMFFITLGLAVGQIIESTGWTKYLALLARPLFQFGRLGHQCSAAFTAAFFSGVTANAMLVDFFKEDKISRSQLFLTNLTNQFPAFFLHLPTTFFIVIPLTGLAGGLYFLLTFIAVLLRTILVLLYGYVRLPALPKVTASGDKAYEPGKSRKIAARKVWMNIKQKLPKRITAIGVYVVPIYIAVFLLNSLGFFDLTRQWLAQLVVTAFIPIEALSLIVLSFAAEFTSGFAAAGALLEAGVLTTKQTVLALLIGNIVAFPLRALRHQLPRYMGIFAPKMGLQLLLLGQGYRVISLIIVGGLYYVLF